MLQIRMFACFALAALLINSQPALLSCRCQSLEKMSTEADQTDRLLYYKRLI